jgi:hypothetical protein
MDKLDENILRAIDKFSKEQIICVLSLKYKSLEGDQKEECFNEIKRLMGEVYGIVGISNF